jgi:hypothetical protein
LKGERRCQASSPPKPNSHRGRSRRKVARCWCLKVTLFAMSFSPAKSLFCF